MTSLFNAIFQKKRPFHTLDAQKAIKDIITSEEPTNSLRMVKNSRYSVEPSSMDMSTKALSIHTSSVFNNPSQSHSLIQNLYEMLEEHIMGHFGDLISGQVDVPASPSKISVEDFNGYIDNLKGYYNTYVKERSNSKDKYISQEDIDVTGNLLKCFSEVPAQYFDPKFHFSFPAFEQGHREFVQIQASLEDHSKVIDENLGLQISSKFTMILDAIRDITEQESKVNACIESIRSMKAINKSMKDINTAKILEVLKLQRKQMNIQKTLQILETINLIKKIVPTLKHLIQRGNFSYAINLLESSEQTFRQKLPSVKCIQVFDSNFHQARDSLQHLLTSEFERLSLEYLSKSLSYNKNAVVPQDLKLQRGLSICTQSLNRFQLDPWKLQQQ